MRTKKVIFFMMVISCSMVYAQQDTLIYTTEDEDNSTDTKDEYALLKYFPEMTEIRNMWKLNIHAIFYPAFSSSFESRVTKNMYCEVGLTVPTLLWNTDEFGWIYSGNAWTDMRFYHGFNRWKKKGRKAHSLFGNYFAIGLTLYASNVYLEYENNADRREIDYNIENYTKDDISGFSHLLFGQRQAKGYMLMPTVKYGLQRRIWDFGFIEAAGSFGVGKSFSKDAYYQNLTVQFKAGLDLQACYIKWIKK